MKRLLITHISILSFIFLLGLNTSLGAESLSRQPGMRVKTIYLDPWYGGKELGPKLSGDARGKNMTLEIAQSTKAKLESKGFGVYLSRSSDKFVPIEQRIFQSKQKRADLYLVINITKSKNDCIRIFTASLSRKKSPVRVKTKDDPTRGFDSIFDDLVADDKLVESIAFADKVTKKLKSWNHADCVQQEKKFEYVLLETPMPTVMIDFTFGTDTKKPPYIMDSTFQKNTVTTLVGAIEEYADERALTKDRPNNPCPPSPPPSYRSSRSFVGLS